MGDAHVLPAPAVRPAQPDRREDVRPRLPDSSATRGAPQRRRRARQFAPVQHLHVRVLHQRDHREHQRRSARPGSTSETTTRRRSPRSRPCSPGTASTSPPPSWATPWRTTASRPSRAARRRTPWPGTATTTRARPVARLPHGRLPHRRPPPRGVPPARTTRAVPLGTQETYAADIEPGGSAYFDFSAVQNSGDPTDGYQSKLTISTEDRDDLEYVAMVWSPQGSPTSLSEYPTAARAVYPDVNNVITVTDYAYPMVVTLIATRTDLQTNSVEADGDGREYRFRVGPWSRSTARRATSPTWTSATSATTASHPSSSSSTTPRPHRTAGPAATPPTRCACPTATCCGCSPTRPGAAQQRRRQTGHRAFINSTFVGQGRRQLLDHAGQQGPPPTLRRSCHRPRPTTGTGSATA